MSESEYIALWNKVASQVPEGIPLCAAGMTRGPRYLLECWEWLERKPDIVNMHYPQTEADIIYFRKRFNRPLMIGEDCFYTAKSVKEMFSWLEIATKYSDFYTWFCLDNMMVPDMGQYTDGKLNSAGRKYRAAMRLL